MKILCLADTTFLEGSLSDSRQVLAGVSLDVETPSYATRSPVLGSMSSFLSFVSSES